LVEWGDAVEDLLPTERLRVILTVDDPSGADEARRIEIHGLGPAWRERWEQVEHAVARWEVPA
jgi:hypothetical protein